MRRYSEIVLCWAYIVGLLVAARLSILSSQQFWILGAAILGLLGVVAALVVPRFWQTGPKTKIMVFSWFDGSFSLLFFWLRLPNPESSDISQQLTPATNGNLEVTVEGKVLSQPRLTRNQQVQIWLEASQFDRAGEYESQKVTGKLYVTVPLLQGTGLHPGQRLAIAGKLYQPKSAPNPGAFDFRAYLARQGAFAGLKGQQIAITSGQAPSLLSQLRERIIRAQVRLLNSPAGPLLSSIVLGQKVVDLPHDIRDRFIKVGLAHVLAASGFHVSLLLGAVLAITRRFAARVRLAIGLGALVIYVGLTGIQPSILRAALFGVGALVALVMQRRVKPFSFLLLVATFLLLVNPLWILDLGFGLSFLATLGLIVTLPTLQKQLDWLPTEIASIIAIPVAASIWTLPILAYSFHTITTYSLITNIVTAPLITLISLGGMISALAALIVPTAGSAIAYVLFYPIHWLLNIVEFFAALPSGSVATGKISLVAVSLIYGVISLIWLCKWWQQRWWLIGLVAMTLAVIPAWYQQSKLVQVTILAAHPEQILVVQNRGQVFLLADGDTDMARYIVLPFLAHQGLNHINCAVGLAPESNLLPEITSHLTISHSVSSTDFQAISQKCNGAPASSETLIQLVNPEPPLWQLHIQGQTWWLLGSDRVKSEPKLDFEKLQHVYTVPHVLLWSGESLDSDWLGKIKPEVAIATSPVSSTIQQQLRQQQIQLYWVHDGAIQWTPRGGFQTALQTETQDTSLMQ